MAVTDAQFSRASTATYYDTSGVLQTAAVDNARVNSNITYTQATPSVTNLLTYSEQFDNAAWAATNATISTNVVTSPDGTITADKLSETSANGIHYVSQIVASLTAQNYTKTVYAKKSERDFLYIEFAGGPFGSYPTAKFDLTNGVASIVINAQSVSCDINAVGDGWYRCRMTAVGSSSGSTQAQIWVGQSGSYSYAGTSGYGIYIWGAQLELGATASTYVKSVGYNGTIPATYTASGNFPSLLYETASTNLLTYSEQFDNAAWVKINATISANAVAAPDGNLTADKIIEAAITNGHFMRQSFSFVSGVTYTYSIFVKASERSVFVVDLPSSAFTSATIWFNLANGVVSKTAGASVAKDITPIGNGWYRISVTATCNSSSSTNIDLYLDNSPTGSTFYAGDGVSGAYVWGAQLEVGSTASSYIPTVASTVTRAADIVGNAAGTFVSNNITENDYPAYSASTVYSTGTNVKYISGDTHKIYQSLSGSTATFTVTIASPAVFTANAHGLLAGTPISFSTTGALPTGIVAGTVYYVLAPSTNTFNISTTVGGSAVNTSGTQSGVHTYVASNNYNQPVTNTTYWLLVGNTNKWRAFDTSITSQSTNTSVIENIFKTSGRVDSIALLNISGASVNIKQIDAIDGIVYDKTYSLIATSGITDWYAYFFEPIVRTVDFAVTDLLPYANSTIVVTVYDTGNTVAIGGLVLGLVKDISYLNSSNVPVGIELGMKLGIQDYSVKTQDTFGNYTILQRAFRKNATMTVFVDAADVDTVSNILAGYRATPTVYVGSSAYGSSIIYGFYKDFSIDVTYHLKSICTITLEGLT